MRTDTFFSIDLYKLMDWIGLKPPKSQAPLWECGAELEKKAPLYPDWET